ncbi:response regulator [Paenibacillus sp. GCM10027626]|uniref:response regulator n=1 Tax=Paenibacillus sp. GCM10027626 TaxID=3273411 RepID=UPI00362F9667
MMRLLIADDEQIERMALRRILEQELPDVEIVGEAENGRQAVELTKDLQPDLVLMDIQMPGLDGLAAIRQIRETQPQLAIIIVSAYDTFDYARQALQMEVRDYILKPSKPAAIVATVRQVLERVQADQAQQRRHKQLYPIVEADLVAQLLFGHVHEVQREELLTWFGKRYTEQAFVMVVSVAWKGEAEEEKQEADQLYRRIKARFLRDHQGWVGAMSGRQIPIIMFAEKGQSWRSQAASAVRLLLQLFGAQRGQYKAFVGIGRMQPSLNTIMQSYQEALLASVNPDLPSGHCFYEHEDIAGLKYGSMMECCRAASPEEESDLYQTMRQYVQHNAHKTVSLEAIAEHVQRSPYYVSKLFKERFGVNYIEFLTECRMNKAKQLIQDPDKSLKQIAIEVGYHDPNYFSRAFKRHCGISPTEYRNKVGR